VPGRQPESLSSLTSLRAFAALSVFAVHANPTWLPGGRSGVSFFFILSGFVLAWSARANDSAAAFWQRRAARILPAYYVAWIIGILLSVPRTPLGWARTIPGWLVTQAWFPQFSIHFAGNWVSWSLSCEILFYLLFPVLHRWLRALDERALWLVALGCVAFAIGWPLAIRSNDPNYFWTYIFPPARLPEFVLGMSLAIQSRRGWRLNSVPVPAALVLWVAALWAASVSPAWASTVAITVVPYALLVTSAAHADVRAREGAGGSVISAWLRSRPLVTAGIWSYAFYLLHQLVLRYLTITLGIHRSVGEAALGLIMAIALAATLYYVVEHPAERVLRGRQGRPLIESY
jgi:peptidoglycan/LPS O-acetylase OafA/YrhL